MALTIAHVRDKKPGLVLPSDDFVEHPKSSFLLVSGLGSTVGRTGKITPVELRSAVCLSGLADVLLFS